MNDFDFANSFCFRNIIFDTYHHTDNRSGAPSHYFAYMISGNCKIVTNDSSVEINEGDIFYIPFNCSYQSYWNGRPLISFISLGFPFMPNRDSRYFPVQIISTDQGKKQTMLKLGNTKNPTSCDIGLFYSFVGELMPDMAYRKHDHQSELVNKARRCLEQDPFAKTADIAKRVAVSEPTLYNAFKNASDVSLNEMRNRIISEKARDLLITTDRSVEEISDMLGFSSTSYFRKALHRHFGMTPSEIRKKYKI